MKPETAAKKLGVLLEATPEDFRSAPITRSRLNGLLETPPEWLVSLRRDGPHPRPVTAAQVQDLLRDKREWLLRERETHADVMAENARVKRERAAKAGA